MTSEHPDHGAPASPPRDGHHRAPATVAGHPSASSDAVGHARNPPHATVRGRPAADQMVDRPAPDAMVDRPAPPAQLASAALPDAGLEPRASCTVRPADPLDIYRVLESTGASPWLLDGTGAHPEARYTILAWDAVEELRIHGADAVWTRAEDGLPGSEAGPPDGAQQPGGTDDLPSQADKRSTDRDRTGPALQLLAAFTRRVEDMASGDSPFDGGVVGWFGFECTHMWEPALPARAPPGDGAPPDAVLRLCRAAWVLDRHANTARLTVRGHDAETRLAHWQTMLRDGSAREPHGPGAAGSGQEGRGHEAGTRSDGGRDAGTRWGDGREAGRTTAWRTSMDQATFEDAVRRIKELLAAGDLFQANIATRFSTPCNADPVDLFATLRARNPSPYMALMPDTWGTIVSGSPELLLAVDRDQVHARPIAGTRPRGTDAARDEGLKLELLHDAKEQAEHTMLVDLLRNDVARVSAPGTVRVPERMSVERYRHVMHLVSRVSGQRRPGTRLTDLLAALFPGGTVTGAPKLRASQRIIETEPVPRGPYTGSAGYLACGGDTAWNIMIRTIVVRDGEAHVHAGSGIVADSDPEREWEEAGHKARSFLEAAESGATSGAGDGPGRLGEVTRHGAWTPPEPMARCPDARVLLVDHEDSFVWNLADYCAALGAAVHVVRHDDGVAAALEAWAPTHVVLSPGPGHPRDVPVTLELIRTMAGRLPLLGVCLGHQALAVAHGGDVAVGAPVHGKTADVLHGGHGILQGLPSPLQAARYHSLHVPPEGGVPDGWHVDARLADGTVMAMRHPEEPVYGLQFHPESLCTPAGLEIVAQFLGCAP